MDFLQLENNYVAFCNSMRLYISAHRNFFWGEARSTKGGLGRESPRGGLGGRAQETQENFSKIL